MSPAPPDLRKRDRRWIKEGRGRGRGADYKRWLNTSDLSRAKANSGERHKQGTLVRSQGRVVQREYHFGSQLEASVFDFWDNMDVTPWGIRVIDILEQFSLLSTENPEKEPAADTIHIAKSLGVRHIPADRPNSPTVMTTDLMVKWQSYNSEQLQVYAIAVKPRDFINNASTRNRIIEKYEVEMIYWQTHTLDGLPVRWMIATEDQIPEVLIENMRPLGKAKILKRPIDDIEVSLIKRICIESAHQDLPLSRLARQIDQHLKLKLGTSIDVIYHLIANGIIEVDLFQPIRSDKPLLLTQLSLRLEGVSATKNKAINPSGLTLR